MRQRYPLPYNKHLLSVDFDFNKIANQPVKWFGETAPSIKCLPHKHETLRSETQNPGKSLAWQHMPVVTVLRKQEAGGSLGTHWTASLIGTVSPRFSKWQGLKYKNNFRSHPTQTTAILFWHQSSAPHTLPQQSHLPWQYIRQFHGLDHGPDVLAKIIKLITNKK